MQYQGISSSCWHQQLTELRVMERRDGMQEGRGEKGRDRSQPWVSKHTASLELTAGKEQRNRLSRTQAAVPASASRCPRTFAPPPTPGWLVKREACIWVDGTCLGSECLGGECHIKYESAGQYWIGTGPSVFN